MSQATGTLPSTTIPIVAPLTKKGVLTVNIPQLHPAGPNSKVILTSIDLDIRKKSKTVGRGKNRKKINLLTSPDDVQRHVDDEDRRHLRRRRHEDRPLDAALHEAEEVEETGRFVRSSDGRRPRFGGAVAVLEIAGVTTELLWAPSSCSSQH